MWIETTPYLELVSQARRRPPARLQNLRCLFLLLVVAMFTCRISATPYFTNIISRTGAVHDSKSMGVGWGDLDGDGLLDLYLNNDGEANVLYFNDGDGTYSASKSTAGDINNTGAGRGVAMVDYDLDHDLDIYIAVFDGANKLFQNQGDGTFLDQTAAAEVGHTGQTTSVAWGDLFGADALPDLYVVNYNKENVLYRNNGNGTFSDVTSSSGVGSADQGTAVAVFDADQDGDLDIFVTNAGVVNQLYINNGNDTFSLRANAGVGGDSVALSYSVIWGDFVGNDTALDLFVVNGMHPNSSANMLFKNSGNGSFSLVSGSGVEDESNGRGASGIDVDSDGYLDIFVVSFQDNSRMYSNNEGDGTFSNITDLAGVQDDDGKSLGVA